MEAGKTGGGGAMMAPPWDLVRGLREMLRGTIMPPHSLIRVSMLLLIFLWYQNFLIYPTFPPFLSYKNNRITFSPAVETFVSGQLPTRAISHHVDTGPHEWFDQLILVWWGVVQGLVVLVGNRWALSPVGSSCRTGKFYYYSYLQWDQRRVESTPSPPPTPPPLPFRT